MEYQKFAAQKQAAPAKTVITQAQQSTKESMKRQMEMELAQEMNRMRMENDSRMQMDDNYAQEDQGYGQYYDENDMNGYQQQEQDYDSYKPSADVYSKAAKPFSDHNSVPRRQSDVAAGGKSRLQESRENKLIIGDGDSSPYVTSSNMIGSYKSSSKGPKRSNEKIFGRQTSKADQGFNVITGEYVG